MGLRRTMLAGVIALAGFGVLPLGLVQGADVGSTPTPIDSAPSPAATLPPVAPETTDAPPTVVQEVTTPVITIAPPRVEQQKATVTPAPQVESGPTEPPTPIEQTGVQPQTPPQSPLPSAAQLTLDARLRWGNRVPASVRRWAFLIVPAGHKYHVNPDLVAAVITMESDGDPLAWNSGSDARGLMQVLHGPWDPAQNIDTGTSMLAGFIAQFHNLTLALAAYNAGPNAVLEYGGVPPYRETHDYVIVVRYLFDLYDHHPLTHARQNQYLATVHDLRHFADQRRKVSRLEAIQGIKDQPEILCSAVRCRAPQTHWSASDDPFWPAAGMPDPLQRVAPDAQMP